MPAFPPVAAAMLAAAIVLGSPAAVAAESPPAVAAHDAAAAVEPGVRDSVVRLYGSVFDRRPDGPGLAYWLDRYTAGVPLATIAASFLASGEWDRRHGAVDDDTFVDLLYANVLGRRPDARGRHYWRGVLAEPGADTPSRSEVLVLFSESPEHVARTGTASPVPAPSALPPVPAGSGHGRRIVYANDAQRVWLIEGDGSVHDSYPVSGRRATPGPGVYAVFSKSPRAWAGHDGITMDHMVRFARGRRLAIGFHSIPAFADGRLLQTLDQLGTHRSAGCVRQEAGKAEALYHWADIGTTVVVLP